VPSLLEHGPARASAAGLAIEFREADTESLPFADAAFDAVVSTFGVMFTPSQDQAAAELLRVYRRGGKIGLANWKAARSQDRLAQPVRPNEQG
jgi:ubiquinone/menaquinone biosynthesis C-methylase UbiE